MSRDSGVNPHGCSAQGMGWRVTHHRRHRLLTSLSASPVWGFVAHVVSDWVTAQPAPREASSRNFRLAESQSPECCALPLPPGRGPGGWAGKPPARTQTGVRLRFCVSTNPRKASPNGGSGFVDATSAARKAAGTTSVPQYVRAVRCALTPALTPGVLRTTTQYCCILPFGEISFASK